MSKGYIVCVYESIKDNEVLKDTVTRNHQTIEGS